MLLGPSDCPRLRFNVLSIDYARVINWFYDYDYDYETPYLQHTDDIRLQSANSACTLSRTRQRYRPFVLTTCWRTFALPPLEWFRRLPALLWYGLYRAKTCTGYSCMHGFNAKTRKYSTVFYETHKHECSILQYICTVTQRINM